MDPAWLLWSGLFSLIGFAAFTYGRRQRRISATLTGLALMVYPYFVSDEVVLIGVGVLLIGGLFVASRYEDSL